MQVHNSYLNLAKYNEDDYYAPDMNDLINKRGVRQLKISEVKTLQLLDYKLNQTTAYDFLEFILYQGIYFPEDKSVNKSADADKLYQHAIGLVNQFILDKISLLYTPLDIAVSSVIMSRMHYKLDLTTTTKLIELFLSDLPSYKPCLQALEDFMVNKNNTTIKPLIPVSKDIHDQRKGFKNRAAVKCTLCT